MKALVASLAVLVTLVVPTTAASWTVRDSENRLASLIREEHSAICGSALARVAQHDHLDRWRSRDMIEREYFSHTILGTSSSVFAYFVAYGIRDWIVGGENIVWNDEPPGVSADSAFREFMASDGHRAIIRNCDLTTFGVGACRSSDGRTMYTTTFSRQAVGNPILAAESPVARDPGAFSPSSPDPLLPSACSSVAPPVVAQAATGPCDGWSPATRPDAIACERNGGRDRSRPD